LKSSKGGALRVVKKRVTRVTIRRGKRGHFWGPNGLWCRESHLVSTTAKPPKKINTKEDSRIEEGG